MSEVEKDSQETEKIEIEEEEEKRNWVDLSHDGGVLKHLVTPGKGKSTPSPKAHCRIHYTMKIIQTGKLIDERKFTFQLNMGAIRAWDICMSTMKRGERCILRVRCDYAYGDRGSGCDIPARATIEYNILLVKWELDWEPWGAVRKYDLCLKRKAEGNAFFKKSNFKKANKRYEKVLFILRKSDFENEWEDKEFVEKGKKIRLLMWSNQSAIHFKKKQYRDCVTKSTQCLDIYLKDYKDEKNSILKLYYRRQFSNRKVLNYKECGRDVKKALKLDPESKLFQKELKVLEVLKEKVVEKEKKAFTGMFDSKWEEMAEEEEKEKEKLNELIKNKEEEIKKKQELKNQQEIDTDSDDDDDDDDDTSDYDSDEEKEDIDEKKQKENENKEEKKEEEKKEDSDAKKTD